ncbi:DUF5886 domain-containing protein [Megavirus chiliensis]|uniref:Uncharacterized protein n=3 Tax=Megamimivirinae TaxID=3044648 RepID=A0A2L2DND2_MIMIV|nr:hypothetical protein MegaChil _gp0820 [Megavirus chiliensis]AEQ33297.1 DUF5886 domain-containing protein [Megavirus chiliensis]AVG47656.1 hypothetical protein [Acanthamoeba polyphaga mimivirus]
MNNFNHYYDIISNLNPKVNYSNWAKFFSKKEKKLLDGHYDLSIDKCTRSNSYIIHTVTTGPVIIFTDGEIKMVEYHILFTIAHHNGEPIFKLEKTTEGYNLKKCKFYKCFLKYDPNKIRNINCHKNKFCKYKHNKYNQLCNNGIWCTSCNGKFNSSVCNLNNIIKDDLDFNEISKQSILSIMEIDCSKDINNIHYLRETSRELVNKRNDLSKLDDLINDWQLNMDFYFENYKNICIKQHENNISKRKELVSKYGLDIDDFDDLIKKINDDINNIESNNKIIRKTEKIKSLEKNLLKQKSKIEKKQKQLEIQLQQLEIESERLKKCKKESETESETESESKTESESE